MTRRLYSLGRWCSAHGWRVVALWFAALALVILADMRLPPPPAEAFVLEGTNSASAQRLLNRAFPGTAAPAAPLAVASQAGLTDDASSQMLADLATAIEEIPDVGAVITPEESPGLLSPDGTTAILNIVVDERTSRDDVASDIQVTAERVAGERAEVALGGYLGATISQVDTRRSEAIGLAAALVILLVVLRRGWPVLVPLLTALLSVGIGLSAVGLLERITFVPDEAAILGTMLGLGVGIDYALFLVTRHRALLLRGFGVVDSAARTAGTAGAGMVFAGGTLIAAVSGLALTGISFLMWLGFAAAIIVGTAVLAALTLVPAMFGILGTRVLPKAWVGEQRAASDRDLDVGFWARLADAVTGRPWPFALATTALLLVMSLPVLSMQFGQTDGTSLPADSPGYRATVLIADGFGPGANGPLVAVGQLYAVAEIPDEEAAAEAIPDEEAVAEAIPDEEAVVEAIPDEEAAAAATGDPRAAHPRIEGFTRELAAADGVASVDPPAISTDGGVAVWVVTPETGPADPATSDLVDSMREQTLPAASQGREMAAFLGGVTPSVLDLNERVADRLLPFIVGVVALSFLLLMVAYRSLVIPAKAAAMNLLSITAAYGVVVMVFQYGWGAELIGLDGPVPIQSFVPMMMFAVLFGLSMDYEVFLLTSFREHWQRTGDMRMSVRRGLADTGQVITSAAAIMVVIFASFVLTDSAIAKMFGVGLATAVLVDATVVRCLLVPSLMVLAAKWTWWLPGWLDRILPELHVEGDPTDLETINRPAGPGPDPNTPAVGVLPAALGAGGALLAGSVVTDPLPALGFGAVAAGVAVWLPRRVPGAGESVTLRLVAVLGGVAIAAVGAAGYNAVVAANDRSAAGMAVAMLLAGAAAAVLPGVRRYAVAVVLGAASMALAAASAWQPVGFALAPVLVAALTGALASAAIAVACRALLRGAGSRHAPEPAVDRVGAGV